VRVAGGRGSALLPAIAMLSLLALLAAMSLLAAGSDLLLATRGARERAAVFAAEGALSTAIEELGVPGAVPEEAFRPPFSSPVPEVLAWRDGSWSCRRSVRLLPDTRDADGDPATPVVLFDRAFGYASAPRATGGFPVLQVLATAESGETRAAAVAEVTPVPCLPAIGAAWTAGGALDLEGPVTVSGVEGGVPAVIARGPVAVGAGAQVEGPDGLAALVDPGAPVPVDLGGALGAGGLLGDLDALPPPPADGPLRGVVWSRGDWEGVLDGQGILLVHNPAFDPVLDEASRLALEEGVFVDSWDPSYSHLDASRRPAELRAVAGGAFRGVVVADRIAAPGGAASVRGGVLTLSRAPLRVTATVALQVRFDREAVEGAGRGPLRHLVARRVLPARVGAP